SRCRYLPAPASTNRTARVSPPNDDARRGRVLAAAHSSFDPWKDRQQICKYGSGGLGSIEGPGAWGSGLGLERTARHPITSWLAVERIASPTSPGPRAPIGLRHHSCSARGYEDPILQLRVSAARGRRGRRDGVARPTACTATCSHGAYLACRSVAGRCA